MNRTKSVSGEAPVELSGEFEELREAMVRLEYRNALLDHQLGEAKRLLADERATHAQTRELAAQEREAKRLLADERATHAQTRELAAQEREAKQRLHKEAIRDLEKRLQALVSSTSWRVTAPLRWMKEAIGRRCRH